MKPYFTTLFSTLVNCAYRQDQSQNVNLPLAAFTALAALIEKSPKTCDGEIYDKLIGILHLWEQSLNSQNVPLGKTKEYQDSLGGVIQVMLVKVGSRVQNDLQVNIMTLLKNLFRVNGKVTENGLIALSGLANGLEERLDVTSIKEYIQAALLNSNDPEVSRLACGVVSDISNAKGEKMGEDLNYFLQPLNQILVNQEFDIDTKIQSIIALGDLCLNSSNDFVKSQYFQECLGILRSAAQLLKVPL